MCLPGLIVFTALRKNQRTRKVISCSKVWDVPLTKTCQEKWKARRSFTLRVLRLLMLQQRTRCLLAQLLHQLDGLARAIWLAFLVCVGARNIASFCDFHLLVWCCLKTVFVSHSGLVSRQRSRNPVNRSTRAEDYCAILWDVFAEGKQALWSFCFL